MGGDARSGAAQENRPVRFGASSRDLASNMTLSNPCICLGRPNLPFKSKSRSDVQDTGCAIELVTVGRRIPVFPNCFEERCTSLFSEPSSK